MRKYNQYVSESVLGTEAQHWDPGVGWAVHMGAEVIQEDGRLWGTEED